MRGDPPPTLPPCDIRSDVIGAIYAGRFTAITWRDFEAAGVALAGDAWPKLLQRLQHVSWHSAHAADRDAALEDFSRLLTSSEGRLREEVEHHRLLGGQSLWGFLNGVALVERLHINHFELSFGRAQARTEQRALGHAFRCHLTRRAIYRALFPVIEALHAANEAFIVRRPERFLSVFGTTYGDEAEDIARSVLAAVHGGASITDVRDRIASVLSPTTLAADPWTLFTLGVRGFLDTSASPLAAAARRELLSDSRTKHRVERRWSVVAFLAWYFWRGNRGLLFGLLKPRLLIAYLRALFPVSLSLFRSSPYASQRDGTTIDLPGMWTFAAEGTRGLILDPAALRGGESFAHAGLENTNPLLPHGIAAESGYAIDQYILRRLTDELADPDGVWTARLENFLLRWVHCSGTSQETVVAALHSIDHRLHAIAAVLGQSSSDDDVRRGVFPEEAWSHFLDARGTLLAAVDDEWRARKNGPLATMLGAYYVHGL
jgi:hypothetical protein